MALIPGTLPNDTCYGTPQDLLELFAQYLDVPAFALSSKVVFSTTNTGFTSDIVWFDTTSATRPIMKITVSSSGFLDYVKNYITAAPVVTIVGADSVLILDASDSSNTKRGLVSDIVSLAVPAAGSITPAQLSQPFTSGTVVTAGGTAIDFTSIPSWVKQITVMFDQVSTNGTSLPAIQLGDSGGVETSGYNAVSSLFSGSPSLYTTSFTLLTDALSTVAISGHVTLNLLSSSTNTWAISGILATPTAAAYMTFVGGTKSLSATLDRVRITTVNGTDTFDAGSVNILYEG